MKRYISSILSISLIVTFSLFLKGKAISQTGQTANNSSVVSTSHEKSPVPSGITPGRARSLAGGVIGLIGLALGWRAKILSSRADVNPRNLAISAIILGLISVILSVVHLITTAGGFGTGGGKAGAIVALVLGLIGVILGNIALRQKK